MNKFEISERLREEADDTRSEERERLLRAAADFIDELIIECRDLMRNADSLRSIDTITKE